MRILHVISSIDPSYGGPSAAFAGLVSAQAAAGLQVTALAPAAGDTNLSLKETMTAAGAKVRVVLPDGGGAGTGGLAAAVTEAVAAADVVHIHALWEPIQRLAAAAAADADVPYLFRPCGMLTGWSLRQK